MQKDEKILKIIIKGIIRDGIIKTYKSYLALQSFFQESLFVNIIFPRITSLKALLDKAIRSYL